jgi:predicted extracellular nuclease
VKHRNTIIIAILAAVAGLIPVTVLAAGPGVTINEIRIDQPGGDDPDEYFELTGAAGESLDDLTYLVIGDGAAGSGVIESVSALIGQSLDANGFFVAAEATFTLGTADLTTTLSFENGDNVSLALVEGFTGANGADLDTDDDGALDSTPWTSVVDWVSLVQSPDGGDRYYSPTTVGPDGDFVPGHVYDCDPDGWQIGAFAGGQDTPGEPGDCSLIPEEHYIHEVQGDGPETPYLGKPVIVEGVVVGDFQGNEFGQQLGGFNLQEESSDADTDQATSEGIFVFAPNDDVSIGDIVEVTGTATEFNGLTEITDVTSVTVVGHDEDEVDATMVSLPVSAISDWEAYEGMLVTFPQNLFISEFFNFDRFGEIVLSDTRQYQGTHVAEPGAAANAVTAGNLLGRITLDDARSSQNPDPAIHPDGEIFTLDHSFRGGDILEDVTGTVDWSFGLYRIQPVHLADGGVEGPNVDYVSANPRPTNPDPIAGDVRVATFNVLNFFTHIDDGTDDCGPTGTLECRGADDADEYRRQLDKLVAGVIALDADIVGIQEIENDVRTDDGDRAHDPVLTLVEELNEAEGSDVWAWVGAAGHYNDYPVRNEIIYRVATVSPEGDPIALANDAFDDARPGDVEPLGRPPLAQTFRQIVDKGSKQKFTVVVNHFKSKGSECDDIGDPDLGDGQGNCNLTRVAQSEALLEFIARLSASSSGVLAVGDLNSYAMEDPITTLESGGMTDLVELYEGDDAYSYVFDGQLGYLDTALATRSLLNHVTGLTVFHINADEPDILDYDTSFKQDAQDALYEPLPYRVSDHDPVIVGLTFGGPKR